jgi:hypothetical protein
MWDSLRNGEWSWPAAGLLLAATFGTWFLLADWRDDLHEDNRDQGRRNDAESPPSNGQLGTTDPDDESQGGRVE